MHATVEAAAQHEHFPFPLLVERLQPLRDPSRSPIFQVMFTWQKTPHLVDRRGMTALALGETGGDVALGELPLESLTLEQQVSPLDLTLLMAETEHELAASLEYNTDLFEAAAIRRMLGHFQALPEGMAADPEQPIGALPILTNAECEQLLVTWNDTARGQPPTEPIHHLIEAQVERTPDTVAVVFGGRRSVTAS